MYMVFQSLPSGHDMIFVALNLNNVPPINLKCIDWASLVYQQSRMNEQLSALMEENKHFRKELALLKSLIRGVNGREGVTVAMSISEPPDQSAMVIIDPYRNALTRSVTTDPSRGARGQGGGHPNRPVPPRLNSILPSQRTNSAPANTEHMQTEPPSQNQDQKGFQFPRRRRNGRRNNMVTGSKAGNELGARFLLVG